MMKYLRKTDKILNNKMTTITLCKKRLMTTRLLFKNQFDTQRMPSPVPTFESEYEKSVVSTRKALIIKSSMLRMNGKLKVK